jgi:hypothetical protein
MNSIFNLKQRSLARMLILPMVLASASVLAAKPSKPNIVFILVDDLGESKDLSAAMPEKADELRKMLHSWRVKVDAKMMTPNPAYKQK